MAHADRVPSKSPAARRRPEILVPPADDAHLREALKYCPPSAYDAACRFRQTGRPEYVAEIIVGVLSRYVTPEAQLRLQSSPDELRLTEDLALDSLTLMEVVVRLEDVLQVSIRDDDLRHFRTLGEVRQLLTRAGTNQPPAPAWARQVQLHPPQSGSI